MNNIKIKELNSGTPSGGKSIKMVKEIGFASRDKSAENIKVIKTKNANTASVLNSNSEYIPTNLSFWTSLIITLILLAVLLSRLIKNK